MTAKEFFFNANFDEDLSDDDILLAIDSLSAIETLDDVFEMMESYATFKMRVASGKAEHRISVLEDKVKSYTKKLATLNEDKVEEIDEIIKLGSEVKKFEREISTLQEFFKL